MGDDVGTEDNKMAHMINIILTYPYALSLLADVPFFSASILLHHFSDLSITFQRLLGSLLIFHAPRLLRTRRLQPQLIESGTSR